MHMCNRHEMDKHAIGGHTHSRVMAPAFSGCHPWLVEHSYQNASISYKNRPKSSKHRLKNQIKSRYKRRTKNRTIRSFQATISASHALPVLQPSGMDPRGEEEEGERCGGGPPRNTGLGFEVPSAHLSERIAELMPRGEVDCAGLNRGPVQITG